MVVLLFRNAYPPSLIVAIEACPPMATEIANRWMRAWPRQAGRLIENGTFFDALLRQLMLEQAAFSPEHLAVENRQTLTKRYRIQLSPPE